MQAESLYIHLPFCQTKCHYCDFVVRVLHHSAQIDRYLTHLELELQAISGHCAALKTLYLGGGTPSILNHEQIQKLGQILQKHLELSQVQEWTLEVNPEQAQAERLKAWQDLGVNRLSLGVQSFDPILLAECGREHELKDIEQAILNFQITGFDNFSLDLIYGLPGQNLQSWQATLNQALSYQPRHVSLYALEVHARTHFGHRHQALDLQLPDEDLAADMYEMASDALKQGGLSHYEIANWGVTGFESQHNQVYWQNLPFAAIGVGAHGYLDQRRYGNPDNLLSYYRQCQQAQWAWQQTPPQALSETIEETVFLGLRRLQAGLDLDTFARRFGLELADIYPMILQDLLEQGYLMQSGRILKLSPGAVLQSNAIFCQFLDPTLPGR